MLINWLLQMARLKKKKRIMFLLRCHLPELPLSHLGRSGGMGNFGGFKSRLSYHNFNNANVIILGILQRLFSASQRGEGGYVLFLKRL